MVAQGLRSLQNFSRTVDIGNVTLRMALPEALTWAQYLLTSRRYLEWGIGGSTAFAAWFLQQQGSPLISVHAVESSKHWVQSLPRQSVALHRAIEAKQLVIHTADLGKVGKWERPAEWFTRDAKLRNDQASMYSDPRGATCCFDMVLVDGRFREACLLQALRWSHESTVVLLHDFDAKASSEERGYERTVRGWYDQVEQSGSMAVLRPKQDAVTEAKARSARFKRALNEVLDNFMR
jgi:hypothetical protein